MKAEDYHARPELSNSMMSRLLKSPAHLRHYLDNPHEPTAAMILGTYAHTALLEPSEWAGYVRGVEGDRRTKAVKSAHQEMLEQYPPERIIKHETYDQISAMVESVLANPSAATLIKSASEGQEGGYIEESVFYTCALDGDTNNMVSCKARIDVVPGIKSMYNDCLVDFKTTTDASPDAFGRSVISYGYHRQAAHYFNCWNASHPEDTRDKFVIIACEKTPPYACGVYELSTDLVQLGAYEVLRLMERYAECIDTDTWDAYGNTIHTLELPAWATPQIG